jgi:hypothetical protein
VGGSESFAQKAGGFMRVLVIINLLSTGVLWAVSSLQISSKFLRKILPVKNSNLILENI